MFFHIVFSCNLPQMRTAKGWWLHRSQKIMLQGYLTFTMSGNITPWYVPYTITCSYRSLCNRPHKCSIVVFLSGTAWSVKLRHKFDLSKLMLPIVFALFVLRKCMSILFWCFRLFPWAHELKSPSVLHELPQPHSLRRMAQDADRWTF